MAQYTFDPENSRERMSVIKALKAWEPNAFEPQSTSRQNLSSASSSADQLAIQVGTLKNQVADLKKEKNDLENKNKEQADAIKIHQKDAQRSSEKIESLKKEIEGLNEVIKTREQEIKDFDKIIQEDAEKNKAELSKKDDEIRRIQDDANRKQRELERQLKSLKQRLSNYEPEGVEVGEQMLFTLDDFSSTPVLIHTNAVDAPYIAKVANDGTVLFQFNVEKGPKNKACQEREKMLEPFCEISDEGGSTIRMDQWGKAKLTGDSIKSEDVIQKAKIRITRS